MIKLEDLTNIKDDSLKIIIYDTHDPYDYTVATRMENTPDRVLNYLGKVDDLRKFRDTLIESHFLSIDGMRTEELIPDLNKMILIASEMGVISCTMLYDKKRYKILREEYNKLSKKFITIFDGKLGKALAKVYFTQEEIDDIMDAFKACED